MTENYETIAHWLCQSPGRTVAFTGAGISTESGIPDFRSPGGIWAKSTPVLFDQFLTSADARHEYWRQKSEAQADFASAIPNIAHRVLAGWQQQGLLQGVITQNIDGMHQLAGSRDVLELHGTAREVGCLDCQARFDVQPYVNQFLETDVVPSCPQCNGLLKHATISFGQELSADVLHQSADWARTSKLFLAMGSSLVVQPAAGLPQVAKSRGARLVIINRDDTPLDGMADVVIQAGLGETLEKIDQVVQQLRT